MTEEMVLAAPAQPLEHIFLAARNSTELESCRVQLADWLTSKLALCESEQKELSVAVENARSHKWAVKALVSAHSAAKRRVRYYEKVLAAVRAGYTMIPHFWADMFAVRVKRPEASRDSASGNYQHPGIPSQATDNPPLGEGKYVSDSSEGYFSDHKEKDSSGKEITKYYAFSTDFKEVEFPLVAAKPELMNPTAQAMSHKMFDEIGIVPSRRGKDPFIIGRINGPNGKDSSFLIAWYLDTRAL